LTGGPSGRLCECRRAFTRVDKTVPAAVPEGIVLRYGSFYGLGASDFLLDGVRKRQLPVIGGGAGIWSFIEITDAAAATLAAVEGGAPGIYNVVDDDPARSPSGCHTWPRSRARNRYCACPPGSGGCSPESSSWPR
jgi:hypothetical protein